jgi:hypothetical protein
MDADANYCHSGASTSSYGSPFFVQAFLSSYGCHRHPKESKGLWLETKIFSHSTPLLNLYVQIFFKQTDKVWAAKIKGVQNRQGPEASLNNNSYSYSTDVCFVECC